MNDDVVKRVKQVAIPQHLIDASTEDLKSSAEESIEPKKEEIDLNDPKLKEKYIFNFSWEDGRGKTWEGVFANKILSIKEQQAVGVMRASLNGGIEFKAMDPFTAEINLIISHLAFSLVQKPEWAEELRELKDVSLLQALYGEVAEHEATFFGY